MSESTKRLDARGLPCPEPVLRVKRAFEEGGIERLEVLVDNAAARENVSRYVLYSGNDLLSVSEEGGVFTLLVGLRAGAASATTAATAAAAAAANAACAEPENEPDPALQSAPILTGGSAAGATLFIGSDRIGTGSDELGSLLMRGFLATLGETDAPPARLVLMNGGVRLAVEGSECLDSLRALAGAGIDILACGTCLKYFKLEDALAVGRVSNMYEIAGALLGGRVLTI